MAVLKAADKYRSNERATHVAVDHLILALYEDATVSRILQSCGLPKSKAEAVVKEIKGVAQANSSSAEEQYDALSKYGENITELAEEGKLDPVIGRDKEVRRLIEVLGRRTKSNGVLVGPAGCGKTAIVEALAQRIARKDVPKGLQNKQIWSLSLGSLISGASHRGEFEERLKSVLDEIKASEGGVILFIDEMHMLLGAGATSGAMDAANLLKPMLARRELHCIGATTTEEYTKYVEKDAAFERRFQRIDVAEPTVEDCVAILRGLRERLQIHHGVTIKDSAMVAAAQLSDRYIPGRQLPDKAIDLVDEACAGVRVQLDSQPTQIDEMERAQLRLEVELTALRSENDAANASRISHIEQKLAALKAELEPLRQRHQQERGAVTELTALKQKQEEIMDKIARAERDRDASRIADLKFGALPDLRGRIAALEAQMQSEKQTAPQDKLVSEIVTSEDIARVVSRWTGVPVARLSQSDRSRLLQLASRMSTQVIGQEHAVRAVADAIVTSRANLASRHRPIASLLFCGPSGVGKTELAKALARELFDSEDHMVRIDMSELKDEFASTKLIGAPPGYVGFDTTGGQLTEPIRRQPYSCILLDEVEKAHASVFNLLLQVLDEGWLTDSKGIRVDFSNTVVIMTSNLGSEHLLRYVEARKLDTEARVADFSEKDKGWSAAKDKVLESVKRHFRPEFLNRLDGMVVFHPLSRAVMLDVARTQLLPVARRLRQQHVDMHVDDQVIQRIAVEGYDPAYGARPVRRWIQHRITNNVAKLIVAGALSPGQTVTIEDAGSAEAVEGESGLGAVRDDEDDDEYNVNVKDGVWVRNGLKFTITGTVQGELADHVMADDEE
jgi:ATP-dependent Clp protease ATP-binding subunit ClpB